MNTDYRPTNNWDFRLRAAKVGEVLSMRSLAALSLTVALIALLITVGSLQAPPLQAQSPTTAEVPNDWNLKPDSLGTGDQFRLVFYSSTKTDATSTSIADYNTFIQNRAEAGHADLDDYIAGFRVVGCTAAVDARDNTATNTNIYGAGVPIYWVNGSKVADDYADFYDGDWDDEANDKDESGADGPDTSLADNLPFTGCNHNGTEAISAGTSQALGRSSVRIGRPNHSGDDNGPIGSLSGYSSTPGRPMYGLSQVFKVLASPETTLSALALEGADGGETITLRPAFNADKYTYTAVVVNRIDAVKLTATKNDDNAMVVITNDDDQTGSPEEAVLDLSVGSNTLTVTVTAQDGAELTYTVTVTRHTADTLVSNTHLNPTGDRSYYEAQSFTTGTNAGGYTISAVDIWLGIQSLGSNTSVKIRENNADNEPGDLVATLTNPASLTAESLNTFLAQDTVTLDTSTTYWISVNEGISTNSATFRITGGDAEIGETGWTIGDSRLSRADETHSWGTDGRSLLMTIKGTAVPTTLVSNTHLTPLGNAGDYEAQSFETGTNAGGYTVSGIDMQLGFASGYSTTVKIRENNADNEPGDLVATLTNPGTLTDNSLNTFTAPAGTRLDASTTYWISVNEGIPTVSSAVFETYSGDAETGEAGWTIGDSRLTRVDESGSWFTDSWSLSMTIKGAAVPTTTLVSNTHLSATGSSNGIEAQSFETGANLDGYTVSQVHIRLGAVSGASTRVKIRKNNASNQPGDLVAALTNPASLTANSLNTFTAPAGTRLDASTTYWLTVNEGVSSKAQIRYNVANAETGETGWSIGDGRLHRGHETNSWSTSTFSMLMTIKGTAVPCDGIWCATLTVQGLGSGHRGCGNSSTGNECSNAAHLSEDEFTHASTPYSVTAARVQSSGQLQLYLSPDITTDSQTLVLHVGSETFPFEDADTKEANHRKWNNSGLSWTTGDTVQLRLTDSQTNATGDPTIDGVPQVGMVLTADISTIDDVDGLPSTFEYEWVRVASDDTETNLGTNSTHTVTSSDVGSTIRVDVSYTDLAGNSEGPLPSEATAAVVPAAGLCPPNNDWCATMTVGKYISTGTFYGFLEHSYGQLDETTIDYGRSFEVEGISIYEPEGPTDDRIEVTLDADVPSGTVFNLGGTEFTADAGSRIGSDAHIWNRPADFAWIDGQEVTVSANLAPAPESATVDGTTLVITHSEDLNTGSAPPAGAYTVKVDGNGTTPSSVSVGTRTVTLTLATPVIHGETVTVRYRAPAGNPLQDISGLEVPDFNNFPVDNNTQAIYRGPTFTDGPTTTRVFEETFSDETVATATNIGQPVAATDPDTGDTLTYTMEGTDAGKFDIVSTSGQLLTRVGRSYDYEQQRTYSVTVVVEDSDDNSDEITVVLSVIDQNEPPLAPTPVFVTPTSGSASKLNVSWNPPDNTGRPSINNYDLQYREVGAANYRNGPQNVSGSRTTISGLKSGTRYQVQVRATNAEGDGPWTPAVERSNFSKLGARPASSDLWPPRYGRQPDPDRSVLERSHRRRRRVHHRLPD